MKNEEFIAKIEHIRKFSLDTLLAKNGRYSKGSDSALHNFEVGADMLGGTPAQAAWGYMTKHLVALRDKVQNNDFNDLEDLEEKCTDIINYTAILYAIGCEENKKYCLGGNSGYGFTDANGHTVTFDANPKLMGRGGEGCDTVTYAGTTIRCTEES